jgi:hypothetical protein
MIFFFNYPNAKVLTKQDPTKLLKLLVQHYNHKVLDLNIVNKLKGSNFLLNLIDLVEDKTVDILHKYQYLELSAMRRYSDYKYYGFSGIDLSLYPDIDIEKIKHNKLLTVINNAINFKYEQVKNGN